MKKIDKRILIIGVLSIIYLIMCFCYFKKDNKINNNLQNFAKFNEKQTTKISISATSQVTSALTETIELHATYYLNKSYVSEGNKLKAGENIIKYKNGKYFTAPYDCVISEINIPSNGSKITNDHYVKISAINVLKVEFNVDESNINNVSLGQAATITIEALDNRVYEGKITSISNIASNGKFTVEVDFDNDGDILLGMTAKISI